jgi:hypothetical protein
MQSCKFCNSENLVEVLTPDTIHYAKLLCQDCNGFQKWLAKPKEQSSQKRDKAHHNLLDKYSEGFCEICLRLEDELPSSQTLHAHHVVEYSAGGTSDASNIRIYCTPCHNWVHHQRTYLGHYKQTKDYSDLIAACEVEMKRTGFSWRSERVLNFCERLCNKRSRHFLREKHLVVLLRRLQELPTADVT